MEPRLMINNNNETASPSVTPVQKTRHLSVAIPTLFSPGQRSPSPHPRHRRRSSYLDNLTAALSSPISNAELQAKQHDPATLVELSSQLIVEHAARRVDLFFYTLVAYHNTHRLVWQGHVDIQHGRGRGLAQGAVTEACHSSLLPALDDLEEKEWSAPEPHYTSILAGTHFMDSLNATVELPGVVNTVDDTLENTHACRQQSLLIIHDVSSGKLNPLQGLQQFLEMLALAFQKMTFTDGLHNRIAELQQQGTFTNKYAHEAKAVNDSYVESLLRLTPEEKQEVKSRTEEKAAIYQRRCDEMQAEILHSKGQHRPHTPRFR